MPPEKLVTITEEQYNKLVEDSEMLQKLIGAGVDNWEGYDFAMSGD